MIKNQFAKSENNNKETFKTKGKYNSHVNTAGLGVMPKSAPSSKACRATYPVWLNGEDPSVGEGVVTRSICAVNGAATCNWEKVKINFKK